LGPTFANPNIVAKYFSEISVSTLKTAWSQNTKLSYCLCKIFANNITTRYLLLHSVATW